MKSIVLILALLFFGSVFSLAQDADGPNKQYGISMDLDLIFRFDDLDQEGAGPALSIGGVRSFGDSGRYRLIPSLEIGSFKWDENERLNSYAGLNLLA